MLILSTCSRAAIIAGAVYGLIPVPAIGRPPPPPPDMEVAQRPAKEWKFLDKADAIARAWSFVSSAPAPSATASLEVYSLDSSPYIFDELTGREVWVIDFGPVDWTNLLIAQVTLEPNKNIGTAAEDKSDATKQVSSHADKNESGKAVKVRVVVDPDMGQLWKIVIGSENADTVYRESNGASATQGVYNVGHETWLGISGEPTPVKFDEALRVVRRHGFQTLQAQEIVAHCVRWKWLDQPERMVWSIHTRGIEPVRPQNQKVPVEVRSHLRHIIDASTGEYITSGNRPAPDLSGKDDAKPDDGLPKKDDESASTKDGSQTPDPKKK